MCFVAQTYVAYECETEFYFFHKNYKTTVYLPIFILDENGDLGASDAEYINSTDHCRLCHPIGFWN